MGEAVLLLGHIPPGELDTSKYIALFIWRTSKQLLSHLNSIIFLVEFCSKFFYQIVTRYSDTIRAQVGFHFFNWSIRLVMKTIKSFMVILTGITCDYSMKIMIKIRQVFKLM